MGRFEAEYRRSLDDPDGFWTEAARGIDWFQPWERVLDASRPPFYRWFAGGRLNTCHNALDRHVDGEGVAALAERDRARAHEQDGAESGGSELEQGHEKTWFWSLIGRRGLVAKGSTPRASR